jgi:hypothetical protein
MSSLNLWLAPIRKICQVEFKNAASWLETAINGLPPGHYCLFSAEHIDRAAFPATKESLVGFPCVRCSCSVRVARRVGDESKNIDLYACACTSVLIRQPYSSMESWRWAALTGSFRLGPQAYARGDRSPVFLGRYDDPQQYS